VSVDGISVLTDVGVRFFGISASTLLSFQAVSRRR